MNERAVSRLPIVAPLGILAGLEGLRMNVLRASVLSALAVAAALAAYGCSSSSSNNPGGNNNGDGGGPGGPGGPSGCSGDGCVAVSLSMGTDFMCAAMKDGTARCWGPAGSGGRGRGNPETNNTTASQPVVQLTNASSVFVNGDNSCAFLRDGTVSCWGEGQINGNGTGAQPGQGKTEVPTPLQGLSNVTQLTGAESATCALTLSGGVSCWQSIYQFQSTISDAGLTAALSPTSIDVPSGAKEVAVGDGPHLCVLIGNGGSVQCIGVNSEGELGYDTGTSNQASTFKPVGNPDNVLAGATHVRAGGNGTCAILSAGALNCWGDNSTNPDPSARFKPVPVNLTGNVVDVAVGPHSCAVLDNGNVWCWGQNTHGELGNGVATGGQDGGDQDAGDQTAPVQVNGVNNAKSVAVSSEATCIIQNDGRVACWGGNARGYFGNTNATQSSDQLTPVVVPF